MRAGSWVRGIGRSLRTPRAWIPAVGLLAGGAQAQSASALLTEGGALPGAPGETDTFLNNPAVNHVGGYAISVSASDGVTTLSHVWGNASGGAGTVLRTETTVGGFQQTSFESFIGLDDAGESCYSPIANDLVGGFNGLDGVWLDDTVVAIERQAVPGMPGMFWVFGSRPSVTADGVPAFVGGFSSTQGGGTENRGLFVGTTPTALLLGGQSVPNLPLVLDDLNTVSFDYRLSALGNHYIAEVQLEGAPSTSNAAMVLDGCGLLLDGSLVRRGSTLPAAVGGLPLEEWENFDYVGVDESGSWFFTGNSDAAGTATDEFVIVDGQIVLREGDVVDGRTLAGAIEGAYRNEDGDLAIVWDVATGEEVLLLNGEIVLVEGDPVDLDGDGAPEPSSVLVDFTGISTLVVGDRVDGAVDLYFTADVDVNGTSSTLDDVEGYFRMTFEVGRPRLFRRLARPGAPAGASAPVPANLRLRTQLAGARFAVRPLDRNGEGDATGTFARSYERGTRVEITAPSEEQGLLLAGWRIDGEVVLHPGPLELEVAGPTEVEPLYMDPRSAAQR